MVTPGLHANDQPGSSPAPLSDPPSPFGYAAAESGMHEPPSGTPCLLSSVAPAQHLNAPPEKSLLLRGSPSTRVHPLELAPEQRQWHPQTVKRTFPGGNASLQMQQVPHQQPANATKEPVKPVHDSMLHPPIPHSGSQDSCPHVRTSTRASGPEQSASRFKAGECIASRTGPNRAGAASGVPQVRPPCTTPRIPVISLVQTARSTAPAGALTAVQQAPSSVAIIHAPALGVTSTTSVSVPEQASISCRPTPAADSAPSDDGKTSTAAGLQLTVGARGRWEGQALQPSPSSVHQLLAKDTCPTKAKIQPPEHGDLGSVTNGSNKPQQLDSEGIASQIRDASDSGPLASMASGIHRCSPHKGRRHICAAKDAHADKENSTPPSGLNALRLGKAKQQERPSQAEPSLLSEADGSQTCMPRQPTSAAHIVHMDSCDGLARHKHAPLSEPCPCDQSTGQDSIMATHVPSAKCNSALRSPGKVNTWPHIAPTSPLQQRQPRSIEAASLPSRSGRDKAEVHAASSQHRGDPSRDPQPFARQSEGLAQRICSMEEARVQAAPAESTRAGGMPCTSTVSGPAGGPVHDAHPQIPSDCQPSSNSLQGPTLVASPSASVNRDPNPAGSLIQHFLNAIPGQDQCFAACSSNMIPKHPDGHACLLPHPRPGSSQARSPAGCPSILAHISPRPLGPSRLGGSDEQIQQSHRKGPSPKMARLSIPSGFTESPQKRPRAPPSPAPPAGLPDALQQLLMGFGAGSLLRAATPQPVPIPHLEIAALDLNLPAVCNPLHALGRGPMGPVSSSLPLQGKGCMLSISTVTANVVAQNANRMMWDHTWHRCPRSAPIMSNRVERLDSNIRIRPDLSFVLAHASGSESVGVPAT